MSIPIKVFNYGNANTFKFNNKRIDIGKVDTDDPVIISIQFIRLIETSEIKDLESTESQQYYVRLHSKWSVMKTRIDLTVETLNVLIDALQYCRSNKQIDKMVNYIYK